jgi:hypothetical protein
VPLAGVTHRTLRAKGIAQDRQLLLYCPAAPTRNDLNPSAHTTARMSTHMTARWYTFDLVIHRRSLSERQSALHPATAQGGLGATVTFKLGTPDL